MKSNRGISLVSLIIYIIVLSVIIGTISTLTKYFYRNTNELVNSNNASEEYSKLVTYLSEDMNSGNVENVFVDSEKGYVNIYLKDDTIHQYKYDENSENIFFMSLKEGQNEDKVIKLCTSVENCEFEYENSMLKINVTINSITYNTNFSI